MSEDYPSAYYQRVVGKRDPRLRNTRISPEKLTFIIDDVIWIRPTSRYS